MYEYLWGQSFHFSSSIPGKSKTETARIHEEMAVDLINVKPGQKIIDEDVALEAPCVPHSGCNVVGITINEYQVSRAKAYNQKAGMDKQCQVVCGNFLEIPFEDESFDGAYSIDATCHAPKLEDVYREIFRVLKPGTVDVQEMLLQPVLDLAKGGETGIFSPMHMIIDGKMANFLSKETRPRKGMIKWQVVDQGCNHGGMIQEGDSECQQGMAEGRFEHQEGGGGVGAAKNDSRIVKLLVELGVDP
ncbi:24-methylenesterol C-methyltransferase 2-like protein [Tanacetum coccineum]